MQAPIRFDSSQESVQPDDEAVEAKMIRAFGQIRQMTLTDQGHA